VLTRGENRPIIHESLETIQVDLRDLCGLKSKLGDYDYCLHTGSLNDAGGPDYARDALEVNALGTRNLAQVLAETELKHFVYFSTFHVYGMREGIVREDNVPMPRNDYASTHLFGEVYVKQIHATLGLPYTILRITNGYGAPYGRESSKWYLVLNDLTRMAYEKETIRLNSNGKAARDFIWIQDICQIIDHLLGKKASLNEVFNLGSEKTTSILDLAKKVKVAFESRYQKPLEIHTNSEDMTPASKGLQVDCTKIKAVIDYELHEAFNEEIHKIFDLLQSPSS